MIIESIRGISASTGVDLFMLMCFGSRERSIEELIEMARHCGLELTTSQPVSEGRTALEFHRSS